MIIEIEDSLDGNRRKNLLEILPIIYAIDKFETRREVAEFLGITGKCLKNRINKHSDLSDIRLSPIPCKGYDQNGKRLSRPDDF